VAFAIGRARDDLAAAEVGTPESKVADKATLAAIDSLRDLPLPRPLAGDAVERCLGYRLARPLHAAGVPTLADVTLRVPKRRRWWTGIVGIRPAGAPVIEAFFALQIDRLEVAKALWPRHSGSVLRLISRYAISSYKHPLSAQGVRHPVAGYFRMQMSHTRPQSPRCTRRPIRHTQEPRHSPL
jgi:hypothetical protein